MAPAGADAGPRIRVVWGTGTGPTAVAAYDAALVDAGIGAYNLSTVSSVVPAAASVEAVGTAPTLGEPGDRLTVVEARADAVEAGRATAGLGWAVGPGPGLFYEAGGAFDGAAARREIETGLEAARRLRDWELADVDVRTASVRAGSAHATAVVLAVYGDAGPVVRG